MNYPVVNNAAAASAAYSAVGTWFDFAQPIVAIFAGLAGGIWACLQIYIWIEKRVKR